MRKARVLRKPWMVVLLAAILSPLLGAALLEDGELALPRDFQIDLVRPESGSVLLASPFTAAGSESASCPFERLALKMDSKGLVGCGSKDECPQGWDCCGDGVCRPVCSG